MTSTEYVAGSCNIGSSEITRRRRIGFIGLAVSGFGFIIYVFSVFSLNITPFFGILFILPGTVAAIGFIQARQKFCAAYGFSSVANVSVHLGSTVKIEDETERKKDRNKAIIISIQSILIGIVVAVLITILGFIIQQY
ncbi:MAG: hypothetical protein JSV04_02025 [Candidatus Heimdallarchaeota archaeon]|nr:MAG: hypothetical protein JSV04_02025 [Candidatus Heimdallarchaeota archaeon]